MNNTDFEVDVRVSIRNYQGGGNLEISEQVTIPGCTFGDMAGILEGFHNLATSIGDAKRKSAQT
jgi:hypothetical protein